MERLNFLLGVFHWMSQIHFSNNIVNFQTLPGRSPIDFSQTQHGFPHVEENSNCSNSTACPPQVPSTVLPSSTVSSQRHTMLDGYFLDSRSKKYEKMVKIGTVYMYAYKCTGVCMCKDSYLSRSICTYTIYIKKKCYISVYIYCMCFFFWGDRISPSNDASKVESCFVWDPLPENWVRKQANLYLTYLLHLFKSR